jgi:hypothetical protein
MCLNVGQDAILNWVFPEILAAMLVKYPTFTFTSNFEHR